MTIHSSHWGAYRPRVEDGRLVAAEPFPADRDPSELLRSVPGAVHAPNRVARPAVRTSWLRGSGGRRGADPFVEVDQDTALDLVAGALRDTYARHGAASVYERRPAGDRADGRHRAAGRADPRRPDLRLTQGSTAQSVLVQVEKAPADAPHRDPHGLPEFVA